MIDRHQPALHASAKLKSGYHILTVASSLTDELSVNTCRAVHRPAPSTRPISLDYGIPVCTIMATIVHHQTCLNLASKFAQSWTPSASPNSLDCFLQVSTIMATNRILQVARYWPSSVSPSSLYRHFQALLELLASTACSQSRYTVCRWIAILIHR
jgi:hypothetical protein